MAIIAPFKAIRPAKDKVSLVVSRSYNDYSKRELNAVLQSNPFSFLHIINPSYANAKNKTGQAHFKLVHQRYMAFIKNNIFIKDTKASFYVYQMKKNKSTFTGLLCGTSVKDYQENLIKKHENTIKQRETLFANYLQTVKFNAEPVLMTYADKAAIATVLQNEMAKTATYCFRTKDKITHKLWVVADDATVLQIQQEFATVEALYIADGHHRSASSNLLAKKNASQESYKYFMSYLIPESEIRIYEYNRMIKDLNGLSKTEFLTQLATYYRIDNLGTAPHKPSKKHHFSMYLEGEFYALSLRKTDYTFTDTLSTLDTQILYKTILEPILGISDLRTDKRIQYGHGKHNILAMKDAIDNGKFSVGFGLVPITITELKAIADAGMVMPPKSTYIKPKLRSGLAIYAL